MRIGFLSSGSETHPTEQWVYAFSGGLIGYYYQVHRIFLENTCEGIPLKSLRGFASAAVLSLILYFLIRAVATPAIVDRVRKCIAACCYVLFYAAIAYATYVLYSNSRIIFNDDGLLPSVLLLFPAYLALSLFVTLMLRFLIRISFVASSVLLFLLFVAYVLISPGSLVGICAALVYMLYLLLLGRIVVGGTTNLLSHTIKSSLETLLYSMVCGVLVNYVAWYCIAQMSLLYPATVYCVVLPVLVAGMVMYGKPAINHLRANTSLLTAVINKSVSPVSAVLFNVALCCVMLLIALYSINYPGSDDSSARMYCATIFKFAEMHKIVIQPFYQHWPLIFQPLLLEMSGLPPYMVGGISALRLVHGMFFFSFIPFMVLLCRKHNYSYRTIIVFVLLVVSSSFTFRMAYADKPDVIAYPAYVSFLCLCVVLLKEARPVYVVMLGGLLAIIYNSKLVLVHGAVATLIVLSIFLVFRKPEICAKGCKKAIVVAVGIFIVVCSLHFIQNVYLRGNPFHPFGSGLFKASLEYKEEMLFSHVPGIQYRKSIPIVKPSDISTINVDESLGMYKPLLPLKARGGDVGYGSTRASVNIVVILTAILLPIILLVKADRVIAFCGIVAIVSYYVWFGWIGDGWRYSTFFPCISLLAAILVSGRIFSNRYLDSAWRHLFYVLLISAIPVGLYSTSGKPSSTYLYNYLGNTMDKHECLEPEIQSVTEYFHERRDQKPVLLVADMDVVQYGFHQPNFLYKPIRWRATLFTNMVYISTIKPTHLLTPELLKNCSVINKYPFLKEYMELETVFRDKRKGTRLFRFDEGIPWEKLHEEYLEKENSIPGHIEGIQRVLSGYSQ